MVNICRFCKSFVKLNIISFSIVARNALFFKTDEVPLYLVGRSSSVTKDYNSRFELNQTF